MFCYLSVTKSLSSGTSIQNNVFCLYFPKTVFFWFYSDHHEVHSNIRLSWGVKIFLHEAYNNSSFFIDRKSVLRIVKPFVVGVNFMLYYSAKFFCFFLHFFCFLIFCNCRIRTSIWISLPFTIDWKLRPRFRENSANVKPVEVRFPVFESHPPVIISAKFVFQLAF